MLKTFERASVEPTVQFDLPAPPTGKVRMYAIAFDLDTDTLQRTYGNDSWKNAYGDIRRELQEDGFEWRQGSLYYGDPNKIDAVKCLICAQRLARQLPWFSQSVRDIRMLRIEDNNDLGPAIGDIRLV